MHLHTSHYHGVEENPSGYTVLASKAAELPPPYPTAQIGRSLDLKQPVIFVSMNYRVSSLGFSAGKEVKEQKIGNLGHRDQLLALRWVQTYVEEFGGDPSKVTIWGESAGAVSVMLQMVTNNGGQEGLFHGVVLQSGGPIPVGDIGHGQQYYDHIIRETGCTGQPDTLDCLRRVPYTTLKRAMEVHQASSRTSGGGGIRANLAPPS
ncbi:Carboxylesterase family-domain-containing protein [Russula dissimulans]|nr:Carboxylesterase family-domain-containing protein [Russula dissimulans]